VILVDTSAWVEYDRATGSTVDERLATLIAEDQGLVAVTEPVVMEVLAGAKDDRRERDLRRFLERFDLLAFDATSDFDAGVNIYRSCRNAGVTPRGLLDCMIAAVAIRHDAAVLSSDHDLSRIATIMSLRLDSASTPAD
jgi:predicted nucleic acid-binding protein